jgi:hypothetical protein
LSTTLKPLSAKLSAIPSPIPLVDPVTMTVFMARSFLCVLHRTNKVSARPKFQPAGSRDCIQNRVMSDNFEVMAGNGLPRSTNGFNDALNSFNILASFSYPCLPYPTMPAAALTGDRKSCSTALAGAIAMAVAMGLGRFFYTPVLPAMMDGLGLGPSEAGWIASANYVGYLLGAILAAWGWAEGIERKVALSALVATALLLLAMGLASDVLVLAGIRFLAGLASAFVMIFTSAIVLSHGLGSGNKPWVQSGHFGGVGIGISMSALMFAILVMFDGGWRMAWFVAAGLAFVGLAMVFRYLPGDVIRAGPAKKEPPLVWTPAADRL